MFDAFELVRAGTAYRSRHVPIDNFSCPNGFQIAVNFTIDFDAMLLRRLMNEPSLQRAKGEFGGRVGSWRLLDLFDTHGVKVTIFTPGRICEIYPTVLDRAVRAGHELADHMWEHRVPSDAALEADHLCRALGALTKITGTPIVGTRSLHTTKLLRRMGVIYNSHSSAMSRPFYELDSQGENAILQLPFHFALDDAMYFSFGWYGSKSAAQRVCDVDTVLEIWWNAFLVQYRKGGYINYLLHDFVSGHALRVDMLEALIRRMQQLPGVWFPTCSQVARHCLEVYPLQKIAGDQ